MTSKEDSGANLADDTASPLNLVHINQHLRTVNVAMAKVFAFRQTLILILSIVLNIILIYLAFVHFPVTQFAWTSNAGAVCTSKPLNEPHIHHAVVADYATQVAVQLYTFDHLNWRRQINGVVEKFFTPSFRDKFIPLFADSKNLKQVLDQSYVVTSTQHPMKPPMITRVGKRNGQYFWEVKVPLIVTYVAGRTRQEDRVLATIVILRVDPSRANPTGIAVDDVRLEQLLER